MAHAGGAPSFPHGQRCAGRRGGQRPAAQTQGIPDKPHPAGGGRGWGGAEGGEGPTAGRAERGRCQAAAGGARQGTGSPPLGQRHATIQATHPQGVQGGGRGDGEGVEGRACSWGCSRPARGS